MHHLKNVRRPCSRFSIFRGFCILLAWNSMLLGTQEIMGQEEFIPPPARQITTIPFTTFTGGIVVIKALLGDYPDTLNFILDTGSGGISLDSMTCLRLHLATELSDRTIRGIAGIRQVRFVYNQKLRLRNLVVDSLNFYVNDYDILSKVYGDRIDGIMGYSFFSRYIVKIDYDSSVVHILSKGYIKYPKGGFTFRPGLISLPVQGAMVKDALDINARFYFDTGAGLCMLLSSDFVKDSALLNTKKKPFLTQAEGLGGKTNMRLTTIKELKFGPYKFRNVPTYIFDDENNVTSYPYLGGLIGNDVLRRFNVYLNYDHREFFLIPNSHYRDPFDYSYTGMSIYWDEGLIKIDDVMEDSPAQRAGFKSGDIIVGMDNNFTNSLQAYKTILQNAGTRIKIVIRRGSGLEERYLRIKNIF